MKKTILFPLILFVVGMIAFSCSDKEETVPPFLTVDTETVNLTNEATTKEITVKTSAQSWSATVQGDAGSWLQVKQSGSKLVITATANEESGTRKGEIRVTAGKLSETVTGEQMGIEPVILLAPEIHTMSDDGETFILEVTSNIEYEATIADNVTWLTLEPGTRSTDLVTKEFTIKGSRNETAEQRQAEIVFKQKNGQLEKKALIVQKAKAGYTGDNGNAVKDDVKVPIARATASSFQPGGEIEKSFDGDYNTLYHSLWDNSASDYFPITLEYFFENEESIDYFVYHPRSGSNNNGNFKEVEVWVATEAEPTYRKSLDVDMKGSGSATRLSFDKKLVKPKSVKFIVKSGAGDRKGFAACAEMEFYKTNPDNFDPQSIFADLACTRLKPGVTHEQIDNIPNSLFRNMAYYMLNNEYPRDFRIATYKAYPHPDDWRAANKTAFPMSLTDNPTGISVDNGEELVVLVGETGKNILSIKIQNLDLPGGDGYSSASSTYPLSKGVNKIKARNKGLVYVFYHTADYQTAPEIPIHFATGKVNGYFDTQKHQPTDWSQLLNAATDKYFDVLGKYAHLTFPVEDFKKYTPDGATLVSAFDDMVFMELDFMGMKKYNRMPGNRLYFAAMYSSYMYSTVYRTSYNISGNDVKQALLDVNRLKASPWGPAHEVGHASQTQRGFHWHGMTEVTNNVHSLYVQTQWGNASRIESEDMGRYNNRYEKAYHNSFVNKVPYPGEGDVFCKLVSLWQLQRYFGDTKGTDFYKDFYEEVRNTPNKPTPGEQQLDFTRMASKVAGYDLTDFFTKWGYYQTFDEEIEDYSKQRVTITQAQINKTLAEIQAMNLPKPTEKLEYISDSNWEIFREKLSVQQGSATKNGTKITMMGWKNVVAYEVYEGEKLVFVSNKGSFTLDNPVTTNTKVYAVAYNGNKTEVNF